MMCKTLWMLGLVALASPAMATQTQYEISFEGRWTSDLPRPGSAHFSTIVGATHNDSVSLFDVGVSASPAVEQVAEVGGTAAMQAEVNSLITAGTANQVVLGTDGFISAEETNTFIIDVDSSYPLLSLLTMIAPSPDWFVGIHDVSLVDGEGDWIPQLVIDLNSYDAGTENGSGLSLNNAPTTPQGLIAALDAAVPNGALFGSGSIARLTITRIPPPACDVADITADGACDVVAGGDGAITLSDFSCYLSEWASASPSADITLFGVCDVAVGGGDGVDLSDFSCYLAEWSQGCP